MKMTQIVVNKPMNHNDANVFLNQTLEKIALFERESKELKCKTIVRDISNIKLPEDGSNEKWLYGTIITVELDVPYTAMIEAIAKKWQQWFDKG